MAKALVEEGTVGVLDTPLGNDGLYRDHIYL
jgi:hypothetical protein